MAGRRRRRRRNAPPPDVLTRDHYPGIFRDSDADGFSDSDDPRPRRSGDTHAIEEVRIQDEIAALLDMRRDFLKPKRDVMAALKPFNAHGVVTGRVKSPFSMINKLRRVFNWSLSDPGDWDASGCTPLFPDVAGVMVVVASRADVNKVARAAGQAYREWGRNDYYASPRYGYRALHVYLDVDGKPVEVQIKTVRQKTISDAAHTAYKRGNLDADMMDTLTALADHADRGNAEACDKIDNILLNTAHLRKLLTK